MRFSRSISANWTVSGLEIFPQVIVFASCSTSRVYRGTTLVTLISESQAIINEFLKDGNFAPPLNLHTCNFTRGILLNWTVRGLNVLKHAICLFPRASSRFYRCATAANSVLEL